MEIIYLFIWFILAIAIAQFNWSRGNSWIVGFLFSIITTPILGFLFVILTKKNERKMAQRNKNLRLCIYCSRCLKRSATVCKYCDHKLNPLS
jgi:hypothetical protein